jgi:hypothetical protein
VLARISLTYTQTHTHTCSCTLIYVGTHTHLHIHSYRNTLPQTHKYAGGPIDLGPGGIASLTSSSMLAPLVERTQGPLAPQAVAALSAVMAFTTAHTKQQQQQQQQTPSHNDPRIPSSSQHSTPGKVGSNSVGLCGCEFECECECECKRGCLKVWVVQSRRGGICVWCTHVCVCVCMRVGCVPARCCVCASKHVC